MQGKQDLSSLEELLSGSIDQLDRLLINIMTTVKENGFESDVFEKASSDNEISIDTLEYLIHVNKYIDEREEEYE
ncbi:hypothetical protein PC41400_08000 [Paenibacillus chitinolyticus]|uniref:Uncharacterized protein n=1 Tax=Paenibacillus chitinolyticus TaxID=79263 RepID=A0A410WT85_9BACL|nr:hypothetical protein [Paenibacillus chitinolyticus]MCY9594045.1 hypothetical protein [Paenibacillus chitinolyticus]MCY9599150.1 hypothetical protein [Paenibacillus chitinolyticus]QAV17609.1 hypothetical protein PC41400_08000 [Paenibacillus chitinolyticus]